MRILPVVERELRVASRRPRLYWGRFFAALIALGVVSWIWFTFGAGRSSAVRAVEMFWALAGCAFVYCLLLGVFITADSISEEKRDGTLGLLFLTNLKGHDVVLGKLFASSVHAFYSLLAMLPVLAIPLLLGGLTGGDYWRVALVLVETLFFSLTVSIMVSAFSKNDRKAQLAAFALIATAALIIPGIGMWLKDSYKILQAEALYAISPIYSFNLASDRQYRTNASEFWGSVAVIGVLSFVAVAIAALLLPRVWQDRPRTGAALSWQAKLDRLARGTQDVRQRYRKHLLDINAFYWLAARDRTKPAYVWAFLASGAVLWICLYYKHGRDMLESETFFIGALILHLAIKIWIASEAGHRFAEDRKSGALELTLSTPLSVRQILEGQFLALFRQFGWAVGAIVIFDVIGLMVGSASSRGNDAEWVLFCLAGIVILVVDVFTIAALGMWLGLVSKKNTRASSQTIFRILILPWLLMLLLLMLVSVSRMGINSMNFFTGAYFFISLSVDVFFFTWASGNLNTRFREVATQRFEAR